MSVLLIAPRDASWFNRPDVYSVKRWHAVSGEVAVCDVHMLLDTAIATPLDVTMPLCRRAACQKKFGEVKR